MRNKYILGIALFCFAIGSCSKDDKAADPTPTPTPVVNTKITFDKDIKAIFTTSCTPCHLAAGGQPKKWEDFSTAKTNIDLILDRVQRETSATGFMPKNGLAKIPDASLTKLKQWKTDGLLEK